MGRGQKSTTYSEDLYHPEDYFLSLTSSKEKGDCHFTKK